MKLPLLASYLIVLVAWMGSASGWTHCRSSSRWPTRLSTRRQSDQSDEVKEISRRIVFDRIIMVTLASVSSVSIQVDRANAEDTIWLTGKMPNIPGQKARDKSDVSGTKKDPAFLRSLSDCKNQCEKTSTAEGLAKPKEDCLSECQDICCTTYQQCTFGIVPRI